QAVVVRPFQTEILRQVRRRGVRLLLELAARMEVAQARCRELLLIDLAQLRTIRQRDKRNQVREVLNALTAAEVDAAACTVQARIVEQATVAQGLLGGGGGEAAVDAGVVPALRLLDVAAEVEVLHLGGEGRRKAAGVEGGDRRDAAAPLDLRAVQLGDAV